MVIWIIGLSASGKTTLGTHIYEIWKQYAPHTVLIDGDIIREIFEHNKQECDYSIAARKQNAQRISKICAWLDKQGINVVCCILSIFEENRIWNRENYSEYFEVYIHVPLEKLGKRDKKGLYQASAEGKIRNVVGVDIAFVEPKAPDYVFDNTPDNADFKAHASLILKKAGAI